MYYSIKLFWLGMLCIVGFVFIVKCESGDYLMFYVVIYCVWSGDIFVVEVDDKFVVVGGNVCVIV